MTKDNFASILGLPLAFHDQHHFPLQAVHHQWKLRQSQWLFLRERAVESGNPASAVAQWDEHPLRFYF